MNMSIHLKTDTSYLFSSLATSGSKTGLNSGMGGLTSILSDYSSIKNGSYGKLLKAYYGMNTSDKVSSLVEDKSASKDDSETITKLKSGAEELKLAAEELMNTENEPEAMYKAVSKFADAYNGMIETAATSNNKRILTTATNMTTATASNKNLLQKIGVTINNDNTLSVDEETFKAADKNTVDSLLGTRGSYAYGISTKASFIEMYAKNDGDKASGIYGKDATYASTSLTSGYSFWSYM